VFTRDGDVYTGRIIALEMPLTPVDVPMSATIAMVPAGVTRDAAGADPGNT